MTNTVTTRWTLRILFVAALLGPVIVSTSVARAFPRGFRFEGFGGLGHGGPNACVSACVSQGRMCRNTATQAARTCVSSKCSLDIQAAHDACSAGPRSADCQSARTTAQLCVKPCLDTLRTALTTCAQTADTCVTTCPTPTPTATGGPSVCDHRWFRDLPACRTPKPTRTPTAGAPAPTPTSTPTPGE